MAGGWYWLLGWLTSEFAHALRPMLPIMRPRFGFSAPAAASIMSPAYLLPAAIPGLAALSSGVARAAAGGLSFAAMLADQVGGNAQPTTAPTAGIATDLQNQLSQFASLLKERLGAMGQPLTGPVELSANVLGETTAIGGQEDAQTVEGLLGEDSKLSSALHHLLAAFQMTTGQHGKVVLDETGVSMASK